MSSAVKQIFSKISAAAAPITSKLSILSPFYHVEVLKKKGLGHLGVLYVFALWGVGINALMGVRDGMEAKSKEARLKADAARDAKRAAIKAKRLAAYQEKLEKLKAEGVQVPELAPHH